MHGNVWEWTQSLKDRILPETDRVATDDKARLLSGGAFDNVETRTHSSARLVHFPYEAKHSYGFRPVRTLNVTTER